MVLATLRTLILKVFSNVFICWKISISSVKWNEIYTTKNAIE